MTDRRTDKKQPKAPKTDPEIQLQKRRLPVALFGTDQPPEDLSHINTRARPGLRRLLLEASSLPPILLMHI